MTVLGGRERKRGRVLVKVRGTLTQLSSIRGQDSNFRWAFSEKSQFGASSQILCVFGAIPHGAKYRGASHTKFPLLGPGHIFPFLLLFQLLSGEADR